MCSSIRYIKTPKINIDHTSSIFTLTYARAHVENNGEYQTMSRPLPAAAELKKKWLFFVGRIYFHLHKSFSQDSRASADASNATSEEP